MRAGSGAARYDPVMRASRHVRRGRVTPTTVLIVLGMAVLAVGLVLPAISKVRVPAANALCANHLREIALGLESHENVHGKLPAGTISVPGLPVEQRLSWQAALLPFVEQHTKYVALDTSLPWDADRNRPVTSDEIRTYRCPTLEGRTRIETAYIGVAGVGPDAATTDAADPRAGAFGYHRTIRLDDVTDGLAQTITVLESANGGPWAQGGPATVKGLDPGARPHLGSDRPFGSRHVRESRPFGGPYIVVHAAMGDGSHRVLTGAVAPEVLEALATIHGKDVVPEGGW